MNNTNILVFVLFVIFASICLAALFAMLDIFFPNRIRKVESRLKTSPGRSFWIGLANLIFFGAVIWLLVAFNRDGPATARVLIAMAILVVLTVFVIFGLVGEAHMVGEHLSPTSNGFRRTVWGAIPLALACALPFIGWFGFFPFVAMQGFGAFVLSLFRGEKAAEPPALPVVPDPPAA